MDSKRALRRALMGTFGVGLSVAATLAMPGPAKADNVGTILGVEGRCNNSPYLLCLYYNSGMNTAYWGTNGDIANLAGYRFFSGTGAGSGQFVKNNAAAVSCDAPSTWTCRIFFNSNWAGPTDYLRGQTSGRLVDTYNENASVLIDT